MKFIVFLMSMTIISCAKVKKENQDPVMLIKISFYDEKSQQKLSSFVEKYAIDVWRESKNSTIAAVTLKQKQKLEKKFKVDVLKFNIMREVHSSIRQNYNTKRIMARKRMKDNVITEYFATYYEIVKWARRLHQQYPFVDVINIGKTYEHRDTFLVKISQQGKKVKKSAFIMSGIHAREWLSVATNVNFIKKLIMGIVRKDKRITNIIENFDFYVLPVANPDGYIFTFRGETTRLWRKTLSRVEKSPCLGVDPNRNFDVAFGTTGVSHNPCTDTYSGVEAFSEKCSDNIAKFAKQIPNLTLFYDIHSYSQLFFVPYSFSKSVKPKTDQEIRRVANLSVTAMEKVNNRIFYMGSPAEMIYPASGSSIDYMHKVLGVPYAFGVETYPDFNARTGFLVNTKDIAPSSNEVAEAIFVSAENIPS